MAKQLQKLELTWIGKGNEPKLEPRILIEDPTKSYGDPKAENMLIHGDNLLALKALEQEFAGKIKCIYIDPPYNTGSAFEYYDDGLEHSLWLTLMRDRLKIFYNLLSEDGSLWISLDDNEQAYCKVMCDELFGRNNFVANVLWQKRTSPESRLQLGAAHDYILVYAKNSSKVNLNKITLTQEQSSQYKNPDNDLRGPWTSTDFTAQGYRPNQMYVITTPAGVSYEPPPGRCWSNVESEYWKLRNDNRLWFGKDGKARPRIKNFLFEHEGISAWTWWTNNEVGHNQEAKKESNELFGAVNAFPTPKPERLIKRVLDLATNSGDIVLDSFLGSGTSAAVAHKMKRRWIGIELGEHANTHCLSRLQKVVDGNEPGGITETVSWQKGGGFKFYTLAPSLLKQDEFGNWVIEEQYNADMLAAAMAKQEGFRYSPDESIYWKQGKSSEKDFIFTTTRFVTVEMLDKLHKEMKPGESLLICCKSFKKECQNRHSNITIKKIPQMLLGRCEFGKNDYSLNIINMPANEETSLEEKPVQAIETVDTVQKKKAPKAKSNNSPTLF